MRESFVFFKSFYDAIAEIPAKYQPAIYAAVCRYSLYGEIPELDGVTKAMFILMKANIDASEKKYNAAIENGKKGGRPKRENEETEASPSETEVKPNENRTETEKKPKHNPSVTESKPKHNPSVTQGKPNQNLNDNVNDNVNDNDNDNVNVNVTVTGTATDNDNVNGAADPAAAVNAVADHGAAETEANAAAESASALSKHTKKEEAGKSEKNQKTNEDTEIPIEVLPLADGTEFPVYEMGIDVLRPVYPGIDLNAELHRMKAWLESNPKRRKSRDEINRFISGWFNRELEKRKSSPTGTAKKAAPSPTSYFNSDWNEFFERAVKRGRESE